MQHLLEQLDWNYIAVVYENTTYGRKAFQELVQNLKSAEICIAKAFPIQKDASESALQLVFDNLLNNAESQITGVVFFVSTSAAGSFLNIANIHKQELHYRLMMVFSETIALEKSLLTKYGGVSKGSFVTSPAVLTVKAFSSHWRELLTNKTTFLRESRSNPWLYDIFRKYKSCRPIDDSCMMPTLQNINSTENESIFEIYAIIATLLHTKGIKDMHTEKCGGSTGMCDELRDILQKNKNGLLKKSTLYQFDDLPFNFDKNISVMINEGNEVFIKGDIPDYEVYQYRRCFVHSENFCLEKVCICLFEGDKMTEKSSLISIAM